jgi:hypothetical protein
VQVLGATPEHRRDGFGSNAVGMARATIRGIGHVGNALNTGSDRVRTMALPNPSVQGAAAQAELNYLHSTTPEGTALWIQSQRQHLTTQIDHTLQMPQHSHSPAEIVQLGQYDYSLYCLEQQVRQGVPVDPQQLVDTRNAAYYLLNTQQAWPHHATTTPNPHTSEYQFLREHWPPLQTLATRTLGETANANTRNHWVANILSESQVFP